MTNKKEIRPVPTIYSPDSKVGCSCQYNEDMPEVTLSALTEIANVLKSVRTRLLKEGCIDQIGVIYKASIDQHDSTTTQNGGAGFSGD